MNWQQANALKNIPGGEIVSAGLKDLSEKKHTTVAALLVRVAASRLASLGLDIPAHPPDDPPGSINQKLYRLLQEATPDAYSQYNALRRRLASFCAIAESSQPR